MSCKLFGGFGSTTGITPISGLGNIPTSQVTLYDGASLTCPTATGTLNDVLEALDACISDKNGTFTPSNSGLTVADGFIVNLAGDMTWNIPVGSTMSFVGGGKLKADFIDPDGIEFVPQVSNPASSYGAADAATVWLNSANGHLYRGSVDLETAVSSLITYDGAATIGTCAIPVSGDLNNVLDLIADEICSNTTLIGAIQTLVGTAKHSTFRVDNDDSTIVEDDFITNTGSSIGIGIGSGGSHVEALSFGSELLARYSADRDIDTAHANTLVDKAWVITFFANSIASIPAGLWEEGITNTDTTYLSELDNVVVIGDGDIATDSRLHVIKHQNALSSIKIENIADTSDGGAIFIATGGADETATFGYYPGSYNISSWQNKAVLSTGSITGGVVLSTSDEIILQAGGQLAADQIVNISSDGVSIGLSGATATATLEIDGDVKMSNLGAGTFDVGDVLTLQADGTIAFEASGGADNLYTANGALQGDREVSGLNVDNITKHSIRFYSISLFDIDTESIELSSTGNYSIGYGITSELRISNGVDNTDKVLKNSDGINGLMEWVDFTLESLTNIPPLPTLDGDYILKYNKPALNFEWIDPSNVGVTDHFDLTNIGVNTHAQIDSHIGDTSIHYTQASIVITESQISDLQPYLLTELNDLSLSVTWVNVPDINITQSSVVQHEAALTITESQISDLNHFSPTSLLTDYGFTDNSANWDTAFSWGDHSLAGYLTSFTELDPVFTAHTTFNIANGVGKLVNDGLGNWSYDATVPVTNNLGTANQTLTSDRLIDSSTSNLRIEKTGVGIEYALRLVNKDDTFGASSTLGFQIHSGTTLTGAIHNRHTSNLNYRMAFQVWRQTTTSLQDVLILKNLGEVNIAVTPALDNGEDDILAINASGDIVRRSAATIGVNVVPTLQQVTDIGSVTTNDMEITVSGKGIIIKDELDGNRYRITTQNGNVFTTLVP